MTGQLQTQQAGEPVLITTGFATGTSQFMRNTGIISMSTEIYQHVQLKGPNLFQRLFRQTPEENAVIEINNILARKPILEITSEDISDVVGNYRINVFSTFPKNFYEFYAVYLNHCLKDQSLSDQEIIELKHLKQLFGLNDVDVEKIHNAITGAIYQKSTEEAVKDGRLIENEKEFLRKLQIELKMPNELADKISKEVRGKYINDYLQKSLSDQRLSPEEEKEYETICKSLMIDAKIDNSTKGILDKYRLYWVIENGELPELKTGINLQRSEKCYFSTAVEWFEQRTVSRRIRSGGSARIKIMKGVYYRVGSSSSYTVSSEEWRLIDTGTIYLTNKRIIFLGNSKNTNLKLDRILSYTPYTDGVEIEKDSGRNPLLKFNDDVEVFSMLISRLLRES